MLDARLFDFAHGKMAQAKRQALGQGRKPTPLPSSIYNVPCTVTGPALRLYIRRRLSVWGGKGKLRRYDHKNTRSSSGTLTEDIAILRRMATATILSRDDPREEWRDISESNRMHWQISSPARFRQKTTSFRGYQRLGVGIANDVRVLTHGHFGQEMLNVILNDDS